MKKPFYLTLLLTLCVSVKTMADNWMSRLPDDLYVAQVSIPGSHDSATGNGFSGIGIYWGDSYARTQDLDIGTQWSLGVRAFDLRPCTTDDGYLNINHGIIATSLRFDDALYQLRDSLIANPSEFVIIHMLHESDGDSGSGDYATMLLELLNSDELKDYFVDFKRNLTVGEMRGKILLTSRDTYGSSPVGAFISNWCGYINWSAQTKGTLKGAGSNTSATGVLYMQDFSDTHADGAVEEKVEAIKTMLDYSTTHTTGTASSIRWIYNFASAYSKVTSLFGNDISLSDGYRDNATYTHAAIIEYLQTHDAGPTGVILMDYAGVDESNSYNTRGKELIDTLIANNFKFIARVNDKMYTRFSGYLDAAYTKLSDAQDTITIKCSSVAADYEDDLAAIKATIDSVKADLDQKYANSLLLETSRMSTSDIQTAIENVLAEAIAAQAAKDLENENAYNSLIATVASIQAYLDKGKDSVATYCPNVASQFDEDFSAIQDTINLGLAFIEYAYQEGSASGVGIDSITIISSIDKVVAAAFEAQKQYDEAVGVEEVEESANSGKVLKVYSVQGNEVSEPIKGQVNVFKYTNGQVKKKYVE